MICSKDEGNTTDWDFDVSTGALFQALATNVALVDHNKEGSDPPLLQDDPQVQQMDIQWDIWCEQRELPTEDEVTP